MPERRGDKEASDPVGVRITHGSDADLSGGWRSVGKPLPDASACWNQLSALSEEEEFTFQASTFRFCMLLVPALGAGVFVRFD